MSKKVIVIVIVILLLALAGGFYFFWKQQSPKIYVDQMTGEVKEVNGDRIKVEGYLDLPGGDRKQATIEFTVTPQTKLINHTLLLGGHKPGEMYTPQTTEAPGIMADLAPKVRINSIKANNNLANASQAEAIEIDYGTFTFGNSQ